MGDAQHKPRISGMSFGLLISELNSEHLSDSVNSFRGFGSIPDSERATLRWIAKWVLGVPVVMGGIGTALTFALKESANHEEDERRD